MDKSESMRPNQNLVRVISTTMYSNIASGSTRKEAQNGFAARMITMSPLPNTKKAEELSQSSKGAEEPLVLVRQYEWLNEPEPGHYVAEKGNRITEWQVKWLNGTKRTPDSISEFLIHPKPAEESKEQQE